jgi:5-methylthioadenosine/S-adenosylhomocysteine deaminase
VSTGASTAPDADIVLISTQSLGMTPVNNPAGAVVYSAHPGTVDTVLVPGTIVKRGGVLVGVDTERVRRLATETRDYLLQQAQGNPRIAGASTDGNWVPATYAAV